MNRVTLSSKNQIVVPTAVRKSLNLKAGVQVIIYAINNQWAIISKQPPKKNYVDSMIGVGKDIWQELGGVEKYLNDERNLWSKK